jgi:hypothetical protein
MLRYFERPLEILGSTQQDLAIHQALYLPPTKGLRDWREQMSRSDLEIFEAIAGDLLGELGYERAVSPVTPSMRSKARLLRAYVSGKQQARRLVRHARR